MTTTRVDIGSDGTMAHRTATDLWGLDVVRRALDEPHPDPTSAELAMEVRRMATDPGAFAAWALAQPWPTFCGIVRIVTGEAARDLMTDESERRDD